MSTNLQNMFCSVSWPWILYLCQETKQNSGVESWGREKATTVMIVSSEDTLLHTLLLVLASKALFLHFSLSVFFEKNKLNWINWGRLCIITEILNSLTYLLLSKETKHERRQLHWLSLAVQSLPKICLLRYLLLLFKYSETYSDLLLWASFLLQTDTNHCFWKCEQQKFFFFYFFPGVQFNSDSVEIVLSYPTKAGNHTGVAYSYINTQL